MDNDVLAELKWEQKFTPDQPDDSLTIDPGNDIKILSFKEIVCNEKAENGEKKLNLAYLEPWRDCSAGQTEKMIVVDGGTEMAKTLFKGIVINKQTYLSAATGNQDPDPNEDLAVFPVIKTHTELDSNGKRPEIAFFGIGYDFVYRGHLFPAYAYPKFVGLGVHEEAWAHSLRISVFDNRGIPSLTLWGEWTACDVCGSNIEKTRSRECACDKQKDDGSDNCFPCLEKLDDTGYCEDTSCDYSDFSARVDNQSQNSRDPGNFRNWDWDSGFIFKIWD